eukprot:649214-Prymnesium_polylepis.2
MLYANGAVDAERQWPLQLLERGGQELAHPRFECPRRRQPAPRHRQPSERKRPLTAELVRNLIGAVAGSQHGRAERAARRPDECLGAQAALLQGRREAGVRREAEEAR